MTKRILCVLLVFLMACCLTGCTDNSTSSVQSEFPRIKIMRTVWTKDDIDIDIDHLEINNNHPYEIVYNDDGADVIIHCIYKEDDK